MLLLKHFIKAIPRLAMVTFSLRTINSPFWKSCKNAALILDVLDCWFVLHFHTRRAPVLASCIETYYCQFQSFTRLIGQKERNFRVRLEIKGKKIGDKKTIYNFFYLLRDHLILILSVVILYAHWLSGNEIK